MADVLIRQGKFGHRDTKREEVKVEAETAVMLPQAKECLRHQKLEEARDDPHPEALQGAWPCLQLDFRLLGSKIAREQISAVLNHPVCETLLWQS